MASSAIVLHTLRVVDSQGELACLVTGANPRTRRRLARAQDMPKTCRRHAEDISGPREVERSTNTTPKRTIPSAILASRPFRDGRPSVPWADQGSIFRRLLLQLPLEPPFQRFWSSKNCLVSNAPAGVAIPRRIVRAIIANTVVFMALSPRMKKVRGRITLLSSLA